MFRTQAQATAPDEQLDYPMRLVTVPSAIGLAIALLATACGVLWLVGGRVDVTAPAIGLLVHPPGNSEVVSPVDGVVAGTLAPVGLNVTAGEIVAEIRGSDGALHAAHSPIAGRVVALSSGVHAPVAAGASLLTIAPANGPLAGIFFVPAAAMSDVVPGIPVQVTPSLVDVNRTGYLMGEVAAVSPLPVPTARLALIMGDDGLLQEVLAEGPVHEVIVEFLPDADAPYGLRWSGPGPQVGDSEIDSGTIASARLVLRQQSPWEAFIGADSGRPTVPEGENDIEPMPMPSTAQTLSRGGTLTVNGTTVTLEVATTQQEREIGLMFRDALGPDEGMAFVFESPTPASMWTRSLLAPIDIVFIDADGIVKNVDANVPPCEADPCPVYPSDGKVTTVVELAGGRAAELGLTPGTPVELTLDP